jgi:NADH-quinone oxidoreductase subunit M
MLAHGVSTGGLFLLVGMIYERTHTREIAKYGGLAKAMPIYAIFFLIITFSSIAVPMTNGFVGEFLVLLGTFAYNKWLASAAVLGVILGAAYMLWMVKKVFFGQPGETVVKHKDMQDLSLRECLVLSPIVVLIFWMGIFPKCFLSFSESSVRHLIENKGNYSLQIYGVENDVPSPEIVQPKGETEEQDGGFEESQEK